MKLIPSDFCVPIEHFLNQPWEIGNYVEIPFEVYHLQCVKLEGKAVLTAAEASELSALVHRILLRAADSVK